MAPAVRVMCAADKAFFRHVPTMIHSIVSTTSAPVEFGIVVEGIPKSSRDKLRNIFREKIEFFEADIKKISGLNYKTSLSPMTYARLIMAELVEWERFIYLDVDVVVMHDLRDLWDLSLGDRPAAAVFHGGQLNAGVLLVDGARWRSEELTDQMLRYARDHAPKEADQAVIEAVIGDRMLRLDESWNTVVDPVWGGPRQKRPNYLESARIVHYLTGFKPWNLGRFLMTQRLLAPWDRYRTRTRLPRDLKAEAKLLAWQLRILALRGLGAK